MPLPANGTVWPPVELKKITPHLRAWDAWYGGDPVKLTDHYGYIGAGTPGFPVPYASQYRGGIIGGIARWFWGQPTSNHQLNRLHIPIAADVCQAGADLLFAEPATFTLADDDGRDTATQDRLNDLGDDTLHGVIAEAAEIGAALGGVYLRASWDRNVVPDKPFLTAMHADAALPEFRYGRLVAVTFWTRVASDGRMVWRHLERHELDSQGVGVIQHGLYQGGESDLGRRVPFADNPATADLAKLVSDGDTISTESPGLACVYIPNQRPQRRWRNDPVGSALGRSDLDGIEHLMDALDETWSSWMRDIRLGKARVFVDRSLLKDLGPGQGATFDADQEIYAPLATPTGSLNPNAKSGGSTSLLQAEQFAIRTAEHSSTADALIELILRTAGYSSQTFGVDAGSARASNLTATEVQSRERRSYLTRDRKMRHWNTGLQAIIGKLLLVDKAIFNSDATPGAVNVAFADSVQESIITLAQTAQALATAKAASTETLVQLVHPDWDDDEVSAEVGRIHAETASAVPDPFASVGGDVPPEGPPDGGPPQ